MSDNKYTREDALAEKELLIKEINSLLTLAISTVPDDMIYKGCVGTALSALMAVIEEKVAERTINKRAREFN